MEQQKDYLYRGHKHADSSNIVLDKSYMRKRKILKFTQVGIFLFIVLSGVYIGIKLEKPYVTVDGERYAIGKTNPKEIYTNDTIAFSPSKLNIIDRLKATFNLDEGYKAKIIQQPLLYSIKEAGIKLKNYEYEVKCLSKACGENNIYKIHQDQIYGTIKE